jgi:cyclopropane fatty-acyl-phospholipid synthase-like methyltransferase
LKSIATAKMRAQASNNHQPDFGTYHHSTPRASQKIREKVKILFTRVFRNLPFARDDSLKILDVGCGLGFLSCVCAEYYPKARIIGFDTFKHASLKESSLTKTNNNAKILGFSERIKFQKGDVFSSDYRKGNFDLFVSNLVFHNLGRKRINAYERLAHWMTPKSYLVLGELFFDYKTDFRRLTSLFGNVQKIHCFNIGRQYKMLVLSDPKK